MDPSGPSIIRGEFFYRDTLFVDVGGNGRRHPRAPESEVKAFLTGKHPRDQVGHWYEAQLIHYGLPRSKDKNTAKVRLQQALNQGRLKVPPYITDMENQMKKDYAAAIRRAKLPGKDASTTKNEATREQRGQKRTNGEDKPQSSKRTKISITTGGIDIDIDEANGWNSSGNPATNESKQTGRLSKGTKSGAGDARSKGRASHSVASPQKSPARQETKSRTNGRPQTTPKPKSKAKAKSEPKVKEEPSAKRGTIVKKEHRIKSESPLPYYDPPEHFSPTMESSAIRVTGTYQLNCPELTEQFSADEPPQCSISLCVDNSTRTIWGSFSLAWQTGVLRIDDYNVNETMTFGWRARDGSRNGRLRFGQGCFGEIQLYGREQVRGWFDDLFYEPVSFDGQRMPGPLCCGRSAYSFQQEWDGFVSETYGR